MASAKVEVLQFIVEWYDPMPQLKRKYLLKFFVEPHLVEMIDIVGKKTFLKKSSCPAEYSVKDFFINGKLIIYSRELEIVDFADNYTRQKLSHQLQPTVLIVSSGVYLQWGKILQRYAHLTPPRTLKHA
jgi:nucleoside-diphosphate kinase